MAICLKSFAISSAMVVMFYYYVMKAIPIDVGSRENYDGGKQNFIWETMLSYGLFLIYVAVAKIQKRNQNQSFKPCWKRWLSLQA